MKDDRFVHTPVCRIPIGRAVETKHKEFGLEVARKGKCEVIPLSDLESMIKRYSSTYEMIYSPSLGIPIGRATRNASGCIGLEVKRGKDLDYISIKELVSIIVHTEEASNHAEFPFEEFAS